MKKLTRDETEHGQHYYLASEVDAQPPNTQPTSPRCVGCDLVNGCPEFCKCTPPLPVQPEQEPVAWWNDMSGVIDLNVSGRGKPLYTTPSQRPWVGLTEDELLHIGVATGLERAAAQMIADKLKEKNGD